MIHECTGTQVCSCAYAEVHVLKKGVCAHNYTLHTNVATCTVPVADCASVDNHVDMCEHMHMLAAVWGHVAKQGACTL